MDEIQGHRERNRREGLSTARVAVFLIAILTGLGLALATRARDDGPRGDGTAPTAPTDESPDWTYGELLNHLRDSGLTDRMTPIGDGCLYVLTDSQDDAIVAAGTWSHGRRDTLALLCQKHATATDAKEEADRRGKETFAWGRFSFTGNGTETTALERFLKALSGGSRQSGGRSP